MSRLGTLGWVSRTGFPAEVPFKLDLTTGNEMDPDLSTQRRVFRWKEQQAQNRMPLWTTGRKGDFLSAF